jgi:hypothetical protein
VNAFTIARHDATGKLMRRGKAVYFLSDGMRPFPELSHVLMTHRRTLRGAVRPLAVALVVGGFTVGAPSRPTEPLADPTSTSAAPGQACPIGTPSREAPVSYTPPPPTSRPVTTPSMGATLAAATKQGDVRRVHEHLPLSFIANAGQTDSSVRYYAQGDGFGYFFTTSEVVMSFRSQLGQQSIRLRPIDASPMTTLRARDRGRESISYFLASARYTNLSAYHEVVYKELWPGIDMVFRGRGNTLKYEFHVAAGADPSRIRLAYEGAGPLSLGRQGDLRVHTALGTLRDSPPRSWQLVDGRHIAIESHYLFDDATETFGFGLGAFDRDHELVIDPSPIYSTLLGGTANDFGIDVAVDRRGNAYVTGQTISSDFPTTAAPVERAHGGIADAFVAKLDPSGSKLVYATYLGGSGAEAGLSIAVDDAGRAYVSGGTASPDFPTTPGAFDRTDHANEDVWVAKLNAKGSALMYSTLLGGSAIAGDFGAAIAVDQEGHAYVAGGTGSLDFPSTRRTFDPTHKGKVNSLDAFVVKLKADGSGLVFGTFLGGMCTDAITGIALDEHGDVYVTGSTVSRDFPTTRGALEAAARGDEDAFVAKINADASKLLYSTYLGGKAFDRAQGIAIDAEGRPYVTGWTTSPDFPTTRGALETHHRGDEDAFVAKLAGGGSDLVYSTHLGGTSKDRGRGIAVDTDGNAYVTGATASPNFPTTPGARSKTHIGGEDAFVAKLNPKGSRLDYSTYLGGSALDFGRAIAVDAARNAYVTGRSESPDFPTTAGALGPTSAGGRDAFVVKLDRHGR